jgi:hypothetical protein
MPPAEARRPEAEMLDRFAAALEQRLDRLAADTPYAGAEPLSRLNRAEYRNVIRDLLAFDAGPILETLPIDEAVDGFDNIGDGLSVSPTLIEAYVGAAMAIARRAVGDRAATTTQVRHDAPAGLAQDRHVDGLPLGTRGGFQFTHDFPLDAVYAFHVEANTRGGIARRALCSDPAVAVALNGNLLELADLTQFRLTIPAGPQTIAVALLDDARCAGANDLFDVFALGGNVRYVEIEGPFDATGPGNTPSRQQIFNCYPEIVAAEPACAREILERLASRAYRRPLGADDPAVGTLLDFYRRGRAEGDFENGIEGAIARMLISPEFIFQFEHEPETLPVGASYELTDVELASRLSFFIWSSIPDDELIELAREGRLSDELVLAGQIERMLADARANALIDNFAGQWLSLRELREALPQDREFDATLREALEQETSLMFARVVDHDLSVLELLDADYTFLNERLASHYGIDGVRGSYMRMVALDPDSPRRGLLGQGSWLTATSVADRTSPVIRGEWFLTHLLGAPVPEPPAGVEADLSDDAKIARENDTLRERLERHRANPNCAACHRIMDPIGLALENFDLVGRWRDMDNGKPIDASATLTDGTPLSGAADLRQALLGKSDVFATRLTERLLTYALGRVIDDRDMPAVRRILRGAQDRDYRFSAIVWGIVTSDPFRKRVKLDDNIEAGRQI